MSGNSKEYSSIIIFIGTIILCILFIILMNIVLNLSIVGNICERGAGDSFSCGGATTIQFQYDDSTSHIDYMIGIFFLIYTICIVEIVSYKSILNIKGFTLINTFLIIVSMLVVLTSTVLLIKDINYGNKPQLKDNQVLIN